MAVKKKVAPKTEDKTKTTTVKKASTPASSKARPIKQTLLKDSFPIVGIGASAGGLQAFEEFFQHLTVPCGMAFILVSHLNPDHASILHELLRKSTPLSVEQITDGVSIKKEHVYVSPPGKDIAVLNGTLQLMKPTKPHGARLPIDYCFRSLALDQKENATGIILSGNGSDGALGIKVIKSESGMVMAQDLESARFSEMPSSAIATGKVDFVLPPSRMPAQLINYTRGPFLNSPKEDTSALLQTQPYLQKIFILLRSRTGHDFSLYKPTTLRRRITRRMNIHQINDHKHYIRYLEENPQEIDLLFKEFLIGVTSFFRDKDAFEALEKKALLELLGSKAEDDGVRVWVPGCSTGEEAYSIAILLREMIDSLKQHYNVQIFATDLDASAIETARKGVYPEGISVDVSPQRLLKYFRKEDNHYRIKKEIREIVVFAEQSLIKDPPFTKLDLISCRNLLIYLNADLQKRLLPLFHYALKPNGVLFLGTSESISSFTTLFQVIDKKSKLFSRKPGTTGVQSTTNFPTVNRKTETGGDMNLEPFVNVLEKRPNIADMLAKLLSERYAPPSVIVNERGDIIYIHGHTGHYLQPAPGQPNLNILAMAREGLRYELAAALSKANRHDDEVINKIVQIKSNGDFRGVSLSVNKIVNPEALRGLLLVTFDTVTTKVISNDLPEQTLSHSKKSSTNRELSLTQELQYTKEGLQSTIEELETSNEELKSANEEMQSLNEELQTVNAELQGKIDELSQANDDMTNLLNATDIATIFLDNDLLIKRFTVQATEVIRLIQSDVGRPISDIVSKLDYDTLEQDARKILRTLLPKETELQAKNGNWFLMRIMPYRTAQNVIDGLVITFVGIDKIKQVETNLAKINAELLWQRDFSENLIETAPAVVMVLDPEWKIIRLNSYMVALSGYKLSDVSGKDWFDTFMLEPERKPMRRMFTRAVAEATRKTETQTHSKVSTIVTKSGQERQIEWYEKPLKNNEGKITGFMAVGQDITERKIIEAALHENTENFRLFIKIACNSIVLIDPKTYRFVEFNKHSHEQLGYTREEFGELTLADIDAINSASDVAKYVIKINNQAHDDINDHEARYKSKDGNIYDVRVHAKAITLGTKRFILSTWHDISQSTPDG